MLPAFGVLKRFKFLRGTALDPFGASAERKAERALIEEYEHTIDALLAGLDDDNLAIAVEIASVPAEIRGFGHVKLAAMQQAAAKRTALLQRFHAGVPSEKKAA